MDGLVALLKKMAGPYQASVEDFMVAAEASYRRFETNLDSICAKYGKEFPDTDIICMKTGEILRDKGTLKRLKPVQFGGARLAVTKRRADKLLTTLYSSQLDVSGRPGDAESIYSNFVPSSVNNSRFADDATKVLSFIDVGNEPSDAETISSCDSSDAVEEEAQDTSDIDSYLDGLARDLDPAKVRSGICSYKSGFEKRLKDSEEVWYSLNNSSDDSADESNTSCRKVFGSVNSCSRDLSGKTEDSVGTEENQPANIGSLSEGNLKKFHFSKQNTEDSGFESGPGKVVSDKEDRQHVRMFCLNDDKINRVMNWVKDQAKENLHFPPPESVRGQFPCPVSTAEQQDVDPSDKDLRSPIKMRKTVEHMSSPVTQPREHLEQTVPQTMPQSPPVTPLNNMNKTYSVSVNPNPNPWDKSEKESEIFPLPPPPPPSNFSSSRQFNLIDSTVIMDSSDAATYEGQNDSGCLTPRRIVRARKRAFTPVQPSYTSEQLIDYFCSPMPKTVIEILSPSCPRRRQTTTDNNVPVLTPSRLKEADEGDKDYSKHPSPPELYKAAHCPGQLGNASSLASNQNTIQINNLQPSHMNNLNKDVTRETNTSEEDVIITKVKLEPGRTSETVEGSVQEETRCQPSHDRHHWAKSPGSDSSITLCEGFNRVVSEHSHILSDVPQCARTPTDNSHRQESTSGAISKSAGFGNKKQIFDRLKTAGCSSESKLTSNQDKGRNPVRARRQLAMGLIGREVISKHQSKDKEERGLISCHGARKGEIVQDNVDFENKLSREREIHEEQSNLSLEEHRLEFLKHRELSMRVFHEDMDVDCCDESVEFEAVRGNLTGQMVNEKKTKDPKEMQRHTNDRDSVSSLCRNVKSDYNRNTGRVRYSENAVNVAVAASPNYKARNLAGATPGQLDLVRSARKGTKLGYASDRLEVASNAKSQTTAPNTMSPVSSRKSTPGVQGTGLSPSTALSHLQLSSPTQSKTHRPALEKICNKELFCIPQDPVTQTKEKRHFTSNIVDQSPRKRESVLNVAGKRESQSQDESPSYRKQDFLSKDLVMSPREKELILIDGRQKEFQTVQEIQSLSKQEYLSKNVGISPSKKELLFTGAQQSPKKREFQSRDGTQSPSKHDSQLKSSGSSEISFKKYPLFKEPTSLRVQSSRKHAGEKVHRFAMPSVQSVTKPKLSTDVQKSSSYECLITSRDSPEDSLKPKTFRNIQKNVLLVSDQSAFNSLKPIKSTKKKSAETHGVMPGRNIVKTAPHNYRWASTPAKGRSVPVLNDTVSTICLSSDDKHVTSDESVISSESDDEVRTISPYSFQSESVLEN